MTVRLTWYGHAALGLETGGYRIIVDPFLEGNPAASTSPDAVEADYILISHGHGDHVGDTLSITRRTGAMVISNDEIANWFAAKGLEKTHGQHLGGGFTYPFGYLKLTFAIHGSALPDGSNGGNPCGFLLTTNDGEKIYMAQDTGGQLLARYPARLTVRYGFAVEGLTPSRVIEAIARKRGCLLAGGGGALDRDKAARILLADYRDDTLGRTSLEVPEPDEVAPAEPA